MARQPYDEDQSINSMTTRQLRQYIADKATEAQSRLDSIDLSDTSRAFRDALGEIQGRSGKIKRSTSNMSRVEMVKFAYDLRQFNSLDTTSGFAKSIEWKENKQRYESFIRNRIAEGSYYWEKYLTSKGNVSKRGYQEYKDYINFIKGIEEYKSQFGYRTLTQYAEAMMKEDRSKLFDKVNKLLSKVFTESRGKGYSQAELNDRFKLELENLLDREDRANERAVQRAVAKKNAVKQAKRLKKDLKKTKKKVKKVAKKAASAKHTSTKQASKSNIKVSKGRTYKGEGVRERLT